MASRRQHHLPPATLTTGTQAAHFDQRLTKDSNYVDESKRRKMIRWLKKTFTAADSSGLGSPAPPHPSDRSRGTRQQVTYTYGDAPAFYRTRLEKEAAAAADAAAAAAAAAVAEASLNMSKSTSASTISMYEFHHQVPRHLSNETRLSTSTAPHVIIIGGGIGGLCLAQGLKKHGIAFTVFERDPTPNYRAQGYRLRINSAGYEALKANLSRSNFQVFLRSTGHFFPGFSYVDAQTGFATPSGVAFAHNPEVHEQVFSVNRAMLRSLLLTDLREGVEIQYGMAFKRFHTLPNGNVEVQFENGKVVEGSVLVGADGTTSRVRRQYIPRHAMLLDTDSGAIYGKTPITPEIEAYFATGSTTMVSSTTPAMSLVIEPRCYTQINLKEFKAEIAAEATELPDLHKYLCWVLIARAEHFHLHEGMTVQDLYAMTPDQVAELSIQMTASWCPRVRYLVEQQAPEWSSFMRISTMSPELRSWQASHVTLLGDAIHTMAPAGLGCNTALQDAMSLVQQFHELGVGVEAIAKYEMDMRARGRKGIEVCIDAGKHMYDLPNVKEMRTVMY